MQDFKIDTIGLSTRKGYPNPLSGSTGGHQYFLSLLIN